MMARVFETNLLALHENQRNLARVDHYWQSIEFA